jgi:MFS family permease
LLVICLATGAWSFSFGVGSQLVTHWMTDHEASNELIGWNHSCHYLGLAAASLAVPWITRRLGRRGAALGMLACGPTLALFPWSAGPVGWFVLRLLNGGASALSLIPLETLVSRDARPEERARNFAFYGVALTLGGALGMWVALNLYEWGPMPAFYLGSATPVLGGVAVLAWLRDTPSVAPEPAVQVPLRWRRHFLSFGTAWSQGFLEGVLIAFLALYLVRVRGLTHDVAGDLMGITTAGIILFQVPVSWLADRLGRVLVLLGCYAVVIATQALAPVLPATLPLACGLFAFGACAGAMYPLGLALLGDGLPDSALARTYSWYLAMECVGSLMGPPVVGTALDRWGWDSMFIIDVSAVGLILVTWLALRCASRTQPGAASAASAGSPRRVA